MSKSLEKNTIIFDSANQEYEDWWKIEQAIYRGASSGGDSVKLVDGDGNEITTITAASSDQDVPRRLDGKWVNGIKCDSIDSGSVEIHVQ